MIYRYVEYDELEQMIKKNKKRKYSFVSTLFFYNN